MALPFIAITGLLAGNLANAETQNLATFSVSHGEQRTNLSNPSTELSQDDTPFGVNLNQITIISKANADQTTAANVIQNIDLSRAGAALQSQNLRRKLQPFLQQPLSPKLISEIRAAITLYFGDINRPFVSVYIPPQEISQGELKIEYIPFQIAKKIVEGNVWTDSQYLLDGINIQAGDEINSEQLIEDLNWLNLNPYRNLTAVFEPGQKPGTTNIILRSNEKKAWSIWAGYNNSGSDGANPNRFFAGFDLANLPYIDHQFGYQLTADPKAIKNLGFFGLNKKDGAFSHSINYFAPITYANGWRHKANIQASIGQSYVTGAPFSQENNTVQIYAEYATPLPLIGSIRSEAYGAIDLKRLHNITDFGGTIITDQTMDIAQFVGGIRGSFSTPIGFTSVATPCVKCNLGHGNFNFRLIGSPGGISNNNSNAAFAGMSGNPAATSRYTYIYGQIDHRTPMGGNFVWTSKLSFQGALSPLPNIEQMSLGGTTAVRGYRPGEGAGETGFVLTNEISFPPVTFSGEPDPLHDRLKIFGFVDTGISINKATNATTHFLSVGAGFDYSIRDNVNISFAAARALKDGTVTKYGDMQVFGGVKIKF